MEPALMTESMEPGSFQTFMELDNGQLEESRCRERQRFQNIQTSNSEQVLLLRAIEDLRTSRQCFEDGIRLLDGLDLWKRCQEDKHEVISRLLTGHTQHLMVEQYVQIALRKSMKTALRFLTWLDQNEGMGTPVEAVTRFEAELEFDTHLDEDAQDLNDYPIDEERASLRSATRLEDEKGQPIKNEEAGLIKSEDTKLNEVKGSRANKRPSCDTFLSDERIQKATASLVDENGSEDFLYLSDSEVKQEEIDCDEELAIPLDEIKDSSNGHVDSNAGDGQQGRKRHTCSFCGKVFIKKTHYTVHVRTHTKEKPFSCDICGKSFNYKGTLVKHKDIHSNTRYSCLVCSRLFKTRELMVKHVLRVHQMRVKLDDLKTEECTVCGKRFYTEEDLEAHAVSHREGFKCHICQKSFKAAYFLEHHLKIHQNDLKEDDPCYTNDIQEKKKLDPVNVSNLQNPALSSPSEGQKHGGESEFGLSVVVHYRGSKLGGQSGHVSDNKALGMSSQSSCAVNDNKRGQSTSDVAVGQTPLVKEIKSYVKDDVRLDERLEDRRKEFDCPYCNKKCYHRTHFNEHVRTHTGEKPFTCTLCSRSFASKGILKNHEETHSDVTYPCSVCGKTYNTRSIMLKHMRVNHAEDEDASHECQTCNRTFKTRSRLEDHARIHTGDKQFTCEVCGKAFFSSRGLRRHRKGHKQTLGAGTVMDSSAGSQGSRSTVKAEADSTNQVKHICSYCGKCFSQKTKLRHHINIHTGERPYKCKVCEKTFSSSINLFIHKDVHTDEKFACQFCDKLLNTRACLYRHRQKQHKDKKVVKQPSKVEMD